MERRRDEERLRAHLRQAEQTYTAQVERLAEVAVRSKSTFDTQSFSSQSESHQSSAICLLDSTFQMCQFAAKGSPEIFDEMHRILRGQGQPPRHTTIYQAQSPLVVDFKTHERPGEALDIRDILAASSNRWLDGATHCPQANNIGAQKCTNATKAAGKGVHGAAPSWGWGPFASLL